MNLALRPVSLVASSRLKLALCLVLASIGCGGRSALTPAGSASGVGSGGGDGEGGSGGAGGGATMTSVAQVSAKWSHVCAIDAIGHLSCWGNLVSGAVGGTETMAFVPAPQPVDPEHTYRKVSAGVGTTCAIRSEGTLWCWGHNQGGPLATGDRAPHATPVAIGSEHDWEDVTIGSGMACGLRAGGRLHCWGSPDYGATNEAPLGPEVLKEPTLIEGTWTALGSHFYETLAVRADGSLWSTKNDGVFVPVQGFEGHAASVSVGPVSTQVVDTNGALFRLYFETDEQVTQTPELPGVTFGSALASAYGRCAVGADHRMYCGDDYSTIMKPFAPLGDGHADWTTVGVGAAFGCGSRRDGSIWCWGKLQNIVGEGLDYGPIPTRIE